MGDNIAPVLVSDEDLEPHWDEAERWPAPERSTHLVRNLLLCLAPIAVLILLLFLLPGFAEAAADTCGGG